jgi:hypothetical protein
VVLFAGTINARISYTGDGARFENIKGLPISLDVIKLEAKSWTLGELQSKLIRVLVFDLLSQFGTTLRSFFGYKMGLIDDNAMDFVKRDNFKSASYSHQPEAVSLLPALDAASVTPVYEYEPTPRGIVHCFQLGGRAKPKDTRALLLGAHVAALSAANQGSSGGAAGATPEAEQFDEFADEIFKTLLLQKH